MIVRRLLLSLAVLPIALAVLAAGVWFWLLYSESGARWAWGQAEVATDGALAATSISGALTPGVHIEDLTFHGKSVAVSIEDAELQVHVNVFPLTIEIGPSTASGARLELADDERAPDDSSAEGVELPVPVSVSNLEIFDLAVEGVSDDGELFVNTAVLSGTLEAYSLNASATWTSSATGALNVSVDGTGDLRSFSATDIAIGSDHGSVAGSANASWGGHVLLDADLGWDSLAWPSLAEPELISQGGDVSVDWSADGWSIAGNVDLGTPRIPSGTLAFDARGSGDEVSVEILEGRLLNGTVAGSAHYSWRAEQPVSLDVVVKDIDVAALEDRVPALLNGAISVSGQLQPMTLSASLDNVNGRVNGTDLLANGTVSISESSIAVDDLRIDHGESYVRLNGWTSDQEGLRFDLFIKDLAAYVADASGSIDASGAASLNEARPFLDLDASSPSLSYAGIELEDIRVEARLLEQAQSVALQAVHKDISFDLNANGLFDNWREPKKWTGALERLVVEAEEIRLSSSAPASLEAARDRVSIAGLCLTDEEHIHVCANTSWSDEDGIEVDAELAETPVNLVNRILDTELEFDQLISGQLDWQMANGSSSGEVALTISEGVIVNQLRPEIKIETEPGELSFRIVDDDIRAGALNLPMTEFGEIGGQFSVDDIADGELSEVEGSLRARVDDIGLFAAIFPAIDRAGGTLAADIRLSGSVIEPVYSGEVVLESGSLRYRPIGLRLDEISLSSQLSENGELELSGQMRVGEGTAVISTRTDFLQALSGTMEMQITGDNLTIIDVPDIKAIASTELDLGFDGTTLSINGRIDVPTALVTPTSLGTSRVSESEDVVIVAGDLPDDIDAGESAIDLQIEGELTVNIGNDVTVDIGLAEADVAGSVVMNWSGDVIPMANGRYTLSGDVLAFGQKLQIVEGGIRFPNVPANRPMIRLIAVREIFGNSEVREAGVLIDGELARPNIQPFTRPVTTEERALTLLVTGSDFNYEQGIGAVDFGTYIAPRVYASYGIGLFDQENVVRVRYDLKRGFGITTTSGQKESGVDLSYRFEN